MKIVFNKSFIHGFIRVLDLSSTKDWPQIDNGKRADYEAIKGDWENVGKIIRKETGNFKRI